MLCLVTVTLVVQWISVVKSMFLCAPRAFQCDFTTLATVESANVVKMWSEELVIDADLATLVGLTAKSANVHRTSSVMRKLDR